MDAHALFGKRHVPRLQGCNDSDMLVERSSGFALRLVVCGGQRRANGQVAQSLGKKFVSEAAGKTNMEIAQNEAP